MKKKIFVLMLVMSGVISSVALAGWDSTSFKFGGKSGKGYLHGTFKLTDKDTKNRLKVQKWYLINKWGGSGLN